MVPAAVCLQIGRKGIRIQDVKKGSSNVKNWVGDRVNQVKGLRGGGKKSAAAAAAAPPPVVATPPAPLPQKKGWF